MVTWCWGSKLSNEFHYKATSIINILHILHMFNISYCRFCYLLSGSVRVIS